MHYVLCRNNQDISLHTVSDLIDLVIVPVRSGDAATDREPADGADEQVVTVPHPLAPIPVPPASAASHKWGSGVKLMDEDVIEAGRGLTNQPFEHHIPV